MKPQCGTYHFIIGLFYYDSWDMVLWLTEGNGDRPIIRINERIKIVLPKIINENT